MLCYTYYHSYVECTTHASLGDVIEVLFLCAGKDGACTYLSPTTEAIVLSVSSKHILATMLQMYLQICT